jgi:hypothetical protein
VAVHRHRPRPPPGRILAASGTGPQENGAPAAALEISTFDVTFGNINQGYYFCVPKVMVTEN